MFFSPNTERNLDFESATEMNKQNKELFSSFWTDYTLYRKYGTTKGSITKTWESNSGIPSNVALPFSLYRKLFNSHARAQSYWYKAAGGAGKAKKTKKYTKRKEWIQMSRHCTFIIELIRNVPIVTEKLRIVPWQKFLYTYLNDKV